jgi:hypothetical protein
MTDKTDHLAATEIRVAIGSGSFEGVYVRMHGNEVKQPGEVGGVVNCQHGIGSHERFRIVGANDPHFPSAVSFESLATPGRFIWMNGKDMHKGSASGGGEVKVRNGQNDMTSFLLLHASQDTSRFVIQSALFQNCVLRLNAHGFDRFSPHGGGVVNCQWYKVPADANRDEQLILKGLPAEDETEKAGSTTENA